MGSRIIDSDLLRLCLALFLLLHYMLFNHLFLLWLFSLLLGDRLRYGLGFDRVAAAGQDSVLEAAVLHSNESINLVLIKRCSRGAYVECSTIPGDGNLKMMEYNTQQMVRAFKK